MTTIEWMERFNITQHLNAMQYYKLLDKEEEIERKLKPDEIKSLFNL